MITVNREAFTQALERCSRVAANKSPMVQLGHVAIQFRVGQLSYRATDARLAFMGTISAEGKPEEFTANARDLLGAVQSLTGDVCKLDVRKDHLAVSGDTKRTFKVKTLSYADYSAFQPLPETRVRLTRDALAAIERVSFSAAADNDDRAHLRAVRLVAADGALVAMACDGKLATRCVTPHEGDDFVATVPTTVLRLLDDLVGKEPAFDIAIGAASIWFMAGADMVGASMTEAAYPPIDNIFSADPEFSVELDTEMLAESVAAVRRADKDGDIIVSLSDKGIRIESYGEGYGVDELDCSCAPGQFGMSGRCMLDALKCAGATVTLGYGSGELDHVSLSAPGWKSLLAPLRLDVVRGKAKL